MFLNLQQCSGFKGAYYFDGSECVHDDKHGVGYYDAMAVMMSMVMVMMSRWMTVMMIMVMMIMVMVMMLRCVMVMMRKSMSSRWYQWQVFAGWGKPGKQSQRFV